MNGRYVLVATRHQGGAGLAVIQHGGAWLVLGQQGGNSPVLGRIVLVAVAVLAVGAFAALQFRAWSRGPDEAPYGNQTRYRPDRSCEYPPGPGRRGRAR